MRKRKPPYILVSVLVVLLSLVFVANGGLQKVIRDDDGHNHQAEQQQQDVIPPTGESRGTASVKGLAEATKNVASGTGAPAAPATRGQHLPDAAPPSIEVTRAIPQKPVPNETMTNSQWYRAPDPKKKGK